MSSEDVRVGVIILFTLVFLALFITKIIIPIATFIVDGDSSAPSQQSTQNTSTVTQNTTVQQPLKNTDYNLDYWKNRIQERKVSSQ